MKLSGGDQNVTGKRSIYCDLSKNTTDVYWVMPGQRISVAVDTNYRTCIQNSSLLIPSIFSAIVNDNTSWKNAAQQWRHLKCGSPLCL